MGVQFISLLTILIAVGSVMFLAYVMTKFIGKRSNSMMKSKYMKIIDTMSLGFDRSIYLIQVGEQYVLMHMSVKGMEFICNLDSDSMRRTVLNTPETSDKNNFGKYFDFFRTENKENASSKNGNEVNDNIKKLRDMFNNKK